LECKAKCWWEENSLMIGLFGGLILIIIVLFGIVLIK